MAEPESKSKNPPGGGGRKILLLTCIVVSASLALWLWTTHSSDSSARAGEGAVRSTIHLETFVLNLAGTDQRAYLRVGIDLGLNQEPKRGDALPIAPIRDTILGVLAEARAEDLVTAAGKTRLKQDLLRALRERVTQIGLEEIYFTEFLIQR